MTSLESAFPTAKRSRMPSAKQPMESDAGGDGTSGLGIKRKRILFPDSDQENVVCSKKLCASE